jgi:hypothetical protein
MDGQSGGVISYGQLLEVQNDGKPAKMVDLLELDGLKIPASPDSSAARRLLFIKEKSELVILSPETYRSTFAQRFLLDRFDEKAYLHPVFERGPFPRNQPYMAQADWVTQSGTTLSLNMRGGYRIDADLGTNLATIPGVNEPVLFSFHRCNHKGDGTMVKLPSKEMPDSRFHLIQTNIPVFLGGRTFEVPAGGKSLEEVAQMNGIKPQSLMVTMGKDISYQFEEFQKIEIPAKGYEMRPAFFFMDNEVFDSVLVQGYLMENLNSQYFESVFSSPWGKVYKILK